MTENNLDFRGFTILCQSLLQQTNKKDAFYVHQPVIKMTGAFAAPVKAIKKG